MNLKRKQSRPLAIIQARSGSARFPAKSLAKIGPWYLAELVVRRVASVIPRPLLVIPDIAEDDHLANQAKNWPCQIFRGSEKDVLGRFVAGLNSYPRADPIIRVTADNPLISPRLLRLGLQHYNQKLLYFRGAPIGTGCEIFPREWLQQAARKACLPEDREHVTSWFYRSPDYSTIPLDVPRELRAPAYRLTVDYPVDLQLIQSIYQQQMDYFPTVSISKIIRLLDQQPQLVELNQKFSQNSPTASGRILWFFNYGAGWGYGHRRRFQLFSRRFSNSSSNHHKQLYYSCGVVDSPPPDPDEQSDSSSLAIFQPPHPLSAELIDKALRRVRPETVVFDIKRTSPEILNKLRASETRVMGIEESGAGRHLLDLLVDPNYYPPPEESSEQQFTGPRYAIIDPQFRQLRSIPTETQLTKVTICFGGTDPGGLATTFATRVVANFPGINFYLYGPPPACTPPNNLHLEGLQDDFAGRLASSQLLIISGGVLKFEVACLNKAAIIIAQNQEQYENSRRLIDNSALDWPCFSPDSTPTDWAGAISRAKELKTRQAWAGSAKNLVDGKGLERFFSLLMEEETPLNS